MLMTMFTIVTHKYLDLIIYYISDDVGHVEVKYLIVEKWNRKLYQ